MILARNHQQRLSGNRLLVFVTFLLFSFFTFTQETYDVKKVGGEKHYVYIVSQGNTIYGILTTFKISENDLFKANPGLSTNLDIGQVVLVPVAKSGYTQETKIKTASGNSNKKIHVVKKGETLYGLSKKYKVTVEEIKTANPTMDGLKKGYELIIPGSEITNESIQNDPLENVIGETVDTVNNQPEVIETNVESTYEYKDSIVKHKVLAHETLYSISKRYMVSMDTLRALNGIKSRGVKIGQELIIPLKSVKVREVLTIDIPKDDSTTFVYDDSKRKESYTITLFLPLFLDANATHLSKATLSSPRQILSKTKTGLDFYAGFLLAADSMLSSGMNLKINVYDTRGDSNVVAKILKTKEIQNSDLIVGPFYNKPIGAVSAFALKNKVHMVIPFSAGNRYLFNNPYVSKFVGSNSVLLKGTLDYVKGNYAGKHIVLIKSTSKKDDYSYEKTRNFFVENGIEFTEKSLSLSDMRSYFKKDELNIVIAPSTDRVFVSNLYVGLNKTLNKFGYKDSTVFHLFGMDDWERFDGIKMKYKTRMNLHYAAPIYLDWAKMDTKKVGLSYRNKYKTDASKYAFHGFDIAMFYLSSMQLYGTGFYQYFNNTYSKPTVNRIQISKIGESHGFENSSYFVIRYFSNYTRNIVK